MANPIIKWAGGKRQLLNELIQRLPEQYNCYWEPFFGSGALFFAVEPNQAIVGDFNRELTNLYDAVQNDIIRLIELLKTYQDNYNSLSSQEERNAYFYEIRDLFNERINNPVLTIEDAAILVFLNKSCYNGLYRVNARGFFNTPTAHKKRLSLFNEGDLVNCARVLRGVEMRTGDFEANCDGVQAGDFVYFDSPYYDTFDTYQAGGFNEAEHRRLADLFRRFTDMGVYCMLSNSNTDFIKDLYSNYRIEIVDVKRMINADAANRVGTEVIIRNY